MLCYTIPMSVKNIAQYIFDLLDYAEEINKLIEPGNDNANYFMTLVYIEDILDKYGRSFMSDYSAVEGVDIRQLSSVVNQKLNILRGNIRKHSQLYDFDQVIQQRGESMLKDWRKLPSDHPNVQHLYQ